MYKNRIKVSQEELNSKHRSVKYLITNRIVGGSFILGDLEKQKLLKLMVDGQKRHAYRLVDYVLIENHYHAILELKPLEEMSDEDLLERWYMQSRVSMREPKKEELEEESKLLYEKANMILSNLHTLKPYQNSFKAYNYEGIEVEVFLDKASSASKYSNDLFKKAKKAKQKALHISIEKDNLDEKLEFLHRMVNSLKMASTIEECEFLYPKKEKNQKRTKKAQPYESFFFEGFKIMLGTSERENVYLLKNSKASDFWFHLKDRPSSHVIVQNTKKTIPDSVIEQAAVLCAKFSVDFPGDYVVDFTQRRNVKVQSGSNVLYNPYTTIGIKF